MEQPGNEHTDKAPAWIKSRSSGLLLHVSSLPGRFGIGNLGQGAHSLLEFLAETGFSYWQVCPVGPTGFGDSPYQTFSSVAGNPYLIDWEPLHEADLVKESELEPFLALSHESTDYNALRALFWPLVQAVSKRFQAVPSKKEGIKKNDTQGIALQYIAQLDIMHVVRNTTKMG